MLRRQRITSASSLSVSGRELVPSSGVVVGSVLETLGSRGVSDSWSDPCASAPSHRSHAMPPRRTRNSDRPRASDRTMVATESNRLPSFKSRRTLSLLENEPRERKSHPEKNLSSDREPSANSGLDIETKNLSATGRGRTFFVDIPLYRTSYLTLRNCAPVLGDTI